MKAPELWILRHGETTWNAEERMQGHLDSPLTQTGVEQAGNQREILRSISLPDGPRFIVSHSGRALATADVVAQDSSWNFVIDKRLMEVCLGDYQGKTLSEIKQSEGLDLQSDRHLWKFSGPGCESLADMTARVQSFLDDLKGPSVIITHGITSRVLRCLVLGIDVTKLASLPGGQGVVHHISRGRARVLRLDHT